MKIRQYAIQVLCLLSLWVGLGWQAQAQTRTVHLYYTDPQGTVLAKTDAQGNILAQYDYTPYGSTVASLGSSPNGPGYTGHVNDPETGLVYMQARYYHPIGRFLSPDPVEPTPGNLFSFNRYAYADNNPVVNIDLTGMSPGNTGECSNSPYPCQITTFGGGGSSTQQFRAPAASSGAFEQKLAGVYKGISNWLCDLPIVGCDAGTEPLVASNSDQAQGMAAGGILMGAVGIVATDGESMEASAGKLVDLASPERRVHILTGDATGGGHLFPGLSGKTSFPRDWSADRVMHEISDVATDPTAVRSAGRGGTTIVRGTRDGVEIQVIVRNGQIVTGYPINLPRNP